MVYQMRNHNRQMPVDVSIAIFLLSYPMWLFEHLYDAAFHAVTKTNTQIKQTLNSLKSINPSSFTALILIKIFGSIHSKMFPISCTLSFYWVKIEKGIRFFQINVLSVHHCEMAHFWIWMEYQKASFSACSHQVFSGITGGVSSIAMV